MQKYTNGKRTIFSTEKAFKVIYKRQGFKKIDAKNDYETMGYKELKSLASEKGINTHKMKKEDIIKALQESEE